MITRESVPGRPAGDGPPQEPDHPDKANTEDTIPDPEADEINWKTP